MGGARALARWFESLVVASRPLQRRLAETNFDFCFLRRCPSSRFTQIEERNQGSVKSSAELNRPQVRRLDGFVLLRTGGYSTTPTGSWTENSKFFPAAIGFLNRR